MKRFHVHISVKDLAQSLHFYSSMFSAAPTLEKTDYAKWMLDDPRVNFTISQQGYKPGLNHLGFQVDTGEELTALRMQVAKADIAVLDEAGAACCYANSDKYWTQDPQDIAWETFHTLDSIPIFGQDESPAQDATQACCIPPAAQPKEKASSACCMPNAQPAKTTACCG